MTWLSVLEKLGVYGVSLAILGWLARTIILHFLNKDVEKYKANLQSAHDLEMEKLHNDLNLRSIEYEIRFRSIHEKQAKIIAKTYSLLYEVLKTVESYVAFIEQQHEPSKEEKFKSAINAIETFQSYFNPRKVFFPQNISNQVQSLSKTLVDISNKFTIGRMREQDGIPSTTPNYWDETSKMIRETIPPLLIQLENDFQKILGVINLRGKQDDKEHQAEGEN